MIPFRQARNYQPASRMPRSMAPHDVDWIVLHDAETPEGVNTAVGIMNYFATTTVRASAHYSVDGGPADGNEITQSVLEKDVAYGAANANRKGIHVEQAGRAAQTREQWLDDYGQLMLPRVAKLVRELCDRWLVPKVFVDAAGLKAGVRGITTHAQVSKAWPSTGHTDPGPNYPMDVLFSMIMEEDQGNEEDFMATLSEAEKNQLLKDTHDTAEFLSKNGANSGGIVAYLEAQKNEIIKLQQKQEQTNKLLLRIANSLNS